MSLRWLQLDEKRLSQQWIFRLAIAIPFAISFLLCIPLWFETTFDFSSTGYAKFLSMFSLPIGMLSLSIPLVAIVAHIHRTIQTEVQINVTTEKNLADGFFSHHKFFIEALSKLPVKTINRGDLHKEMKINDPYQVYKNIFPDSSYKKGMIFDKLGESRCRIEDSFHEIEKETSNKLNKKDIERHELIFSLHEITTNIKIIQNELSITTSYIEKNKQNRLIMDRRQYRFMRMVSKNISEDDIKEDLQNTVYFANRIFSLLNTSSFEMQDSTLFYCNLNNEKYTIFASLFNSSIPIDDEENFQFSYNEKDIEKTRKMLVEYNSYRIRVPPQWRTYLSQ
ncbi:hypothetical protein PEC301937_18230 [Pectobacterium carotovorum subsp. carotovorum]|nr:hypothetical protein PEC301937_18230 [Pectobacterium carotovorum subsp. carotovorum]